MSQTLRIELIGLPDKRLGENSTRRMSWREYAKLKAEERDRWWGLLKEASFNIPVWLMAHDGPVAVIIILKGTGNRIDAPNLAGNVSLKSLVDMLGEKHGLGIIKDDSPRHLKPFTVHVEPDGEPMTVVEVTAHDHRR